MAKDRVKEQERRKRSNIKYKNKQDQLIFELSDKERYLFKKHLHYFLSTEDNIDGEYWKKLKGYENIYLISNYGRIKGGPRNILKKPHLHHSGYYTTCLFDNKKEKYVIYSRLIAINFIENKNLLPEVNHKNKIRIDNRHSNLEWTTSVENSRHRIDNSKESTKRAIVQMDMEGVPIREWESIADAGRYLGGKCSGNIVSAMQGKLKSCRGFKWKYK